MGHIRPAVKDSSTKKSQVGLEGKQSSEDLRGILTFWLSHRYEMFFLDQDTANGLLWNFGTESTDLLR